MSKTKISPSRIAKAIVGAASLIATWGVTALGDGQVSLVEWLGLIVVLGGAYGVYQVPNRPPAGEPSSPVLSEQDPQVQTGG